MRAGTPPRLFRISTSRPFVRAVSRSRSAAGEASLRCAGRPEQETEALSLSGRQFQATQGLIAGRARPAEHGCAGAGTQGLLHRPQQVEPGTRPDHQHARGIEPGIGERRRIRQVRRSQPGDPARLHPAVAADSARSAGSSRRISPTPAAGTQQFHQCGQRPAATRQALIEAAKTGRNGCRRVPTPPPRHSAGWRSSSASVSLTA